MPACEAEEEEVKRRPAWLKKGTFCYVGVGCVAHASRMRASSRPETRASGRYWPSDCSSCSRTAFAAPGCVDPARFGVDECPACQAMTERVRERCPANERQSLLLYAGSTTVEAWSRPSAHMSTHRGCRYVVDERASGSAVTQQVLCETAQATDSSAVRFSHCPRRDLEAVSRALP